RAVHGGTVTSTLTEIARGRFGFDSSTGVVTVANAALLDYETATSHNITVKAADASGAFTTQSFTIDVTDVAPTTPTDSDGASGGSISEGASNGDHDGITAASTDVHGGTVTFSLTDTAGGRFAIDSSTGVVTVANAALLDYETATSHNISVISLHDALPISTQSFTIDVTDVAPTTPTDSDGASGGSISEGASNGGHVGITAASTDVHGGTVTFSLTDTAGGRFAIDSSTGVLTLANAALPDY